MRAARAASTAALLTVLVLLTGAACRHQPDPAPSAGTAERPPPADGDAAAGEEQDVRRATAPVPAGMRLAALDFGDHDRGYALFVKCAEGTCVPALAATFDSAGSWISRSLPAAPAPRFELRVLDRDSIAVYADGLAWYVSNDSGATFQTRPPTSVPAEVTVAEGRYRVRTQLVRLAADAGERPVPVQPPLDLRRPVTLVERGDRLWLAGVDGSGALSTAYSPDGGTTWQSARPTPEGAGRDIAFAVTAREPYTVWLSATVTANGRDQRRLWRQTTAGQWTEAPVEGGVVGAAGLGAVNGTLFVANAFGVGVVLDDGRTWRFPVGPRAIQDLRLLPDGWVLGIWDTQVRDGEPDRRWLCECTGAVGGRYRWIEVVLDAPRG